MTNLDFLSAKYGQQMIDSWSGDKKVLENGITSALSILNKQGIYAMFLWLHADNKPERGQLGGNVAQMFQDDAMPLPSDAVLFAPNDVTGSMNRVREQLTQDIRIMFFAKELINQTLIYARYRAKAK